MVMVVAAQNSHSCRVCWITLMCLQLKIRVAERIPWWYLNVATITLFTCSVWNNCWCLYFWTTEMATFQVLVYILLLCSQSFSRTVCDFKHTKEPLNGHHCVAKANTEITISYKDCELQWLIKKTCLYINHNYGTDQCHLGLDKYESLVPVWDDIFTPSTIFSSPHYK